MVPKIVGTVSAALIVACAGDRANDGDRSAIPPTGDRDADRRHSIVFLGTSLTAGLGGAPEEAYPALIQDTLDALGLDYRVVNAGVSGETSAGGLRRVDWLLQQPVDILLLELGANDGLRGLDVPTMKANLQGIIDRTRTAHPAAEIVIAGMEAPPNMGADYTRAFRDVFPALARDNDATLIPFLLAGVGGIEELNQADGIHPTPEGHRIIAVNVWRVLAEMVGGQGR